ncbi:MAG TPA: hypothetical protein VKI61_04665 [Chitinophagaceae bacterium]|jgi:hypothetical protein|nr:hypothetical protein [Chitinophagaceae bacterium]
MRLLLLPLCLFVFFQTNLLAQKKPFTDIYGELPEKGVYRFDSFRDGTVVFRNGIISSARLNYNISLDEMHFVNSSGDTLSVADPITINFISVNGSRFYYDKGNGYLQVIDTAGKITLAFKQGFMQQQQRVGAYGTTTPHEGVRSYTYFTGNGQTYKLGDDEKITVTTREYYFFGDEYGHFIKAGKEFIYDHFPKNQPEIKSFLKTNHINFNKIEDLTSLFRYCSKLKA